MEMKEAEQDVNANIEANIQYFLDRFYMSRISIRMLINQHSAWGCGGSVRLNTGGPNLT